MWGIWCYYARASGFYVGGTRYTFKSHTDLPLPSIVDGMLLDACFGVRAPAHVIEQRGSTHFGAQQRPKRPASPAARARSRRATSEEEPKRAAMQRGDDRKQRREGATVPPAQHKAQRGQHHRGDVGEGVPQADQHRHVAAAHLLVVLQAATVMLLG